MVDRGSQGNPALASAVSAGFSARPAVFYPVIVTAGPERAAACANRADSSRQTGPGQAETRQVPKSSANSAAIELGPQGPRGFTEKRHRGFPLWSSVFSVVKICAAACQEAAGISIVGRKRGFCRAFVSCSNEYAILNNVGSLHARPKKEIPTGSP